MVDSENFLDLKIEYPREVFIELPIKPASAQSKGKKKSVVVSKIKEITRSYDFIFSGDVKVDIDWYVHERKRYESDCTPDVDNIIKPILDALYGKDGILIDDSQVQSVSSIWLDCYKDEERFSVRIKSHFPEERLPKNNLLFIKFSNGLCWPFNWPLIEDNIPNNFILELLENVEKRIITRDKIMGIDLGYYFASRIMPCQRFFHSSKIQEFPIEDIGSFKKKLEEKTK